MYNQIFFTNVLRLMKEQGMTKKKLAEAAGFSISFLSDVTNGKANPSLKIMEAIATALNAPLPALLEAPVIGNDPATVLPDGRIIRRLPAGLNRVTAILNDYQAYKVRQWNDANIKALQTPEKKKTLKVVASK